jgi:hypothetical protein
MSFDFLIVADLQNSNLQKNRRELNVSTRLPLRNGKKPRQRWTFSNVVPSESTNKKRRAPSKY